MLDLLFEVGKYGLDPRGCETSTASFWKGSGRCDSDSGCFGLSVPGVVRHGVL